MQLWRYAVAQDYAEAREWFDKVPGGGDKDRLGDLSNIAVHARREAIADARPRVREQDGLIRANFAKAPAAMHHHVPRSEWCNINYCHGDEILTVGQGQI
jgi:hypothetical protein